MTTFRYLVAWTLLTAAVLLELLSTALNLRKRVRGPGPSGLTCLPTVVAVAGCVALPDVERQAMSFLGWFGFYLLVAWVIPRMWARAVRYGETALHRAVRAGDLAAAERAICRGVDTNTRAFEGITALHSAVRQRDERMVCLLLGHGADAKATDGYLRTPLHYACAQNLHAIARLLLGAGADANARDMRGETSLRWARDRGHAEVEAVLREHGGTE